ncbi:hypothetical protein JOM56_011999 [Amanita muscaria]
MEASILSFVTIVKVFIKFLEALYLHILRCSTKSPTGINEDGRANTRDDCNITPRFQLIDTTLILFVMDQTQYSASGSIMPLEIRDFDSYINVLKANEALAHFINERSVSDKGYEAIKKDNASDKRDCAE